MQGLALLLAFIMLRTIREGAYREEAGSASSTQAVLLAHYRNYSAMGIGIFYCARGIVMFRVVAFTAT